MRVGDKLLRIAEDRYSRPPHKGKVYVVIEIVGRTCGCGGDGNHPTFYVGIPLHSQFLTCIGEGLWERVCNSTPCEEE